MILPQTYTESLFLLAVSLLLLGSWPVLFKKSPGRRFELFALDFAVGLFLAALLYALTFGNMGLDGFAFVDDVLHAGKKQWVIGFAAGGFFNLGSILLLGAISVAGVAVAVTAATGLSLMLGVGLPHLLRGSANPLFLCLAFAALFGAIACAALVHGAEIGLQVQTLVRQAQAAQKKLKRKPSSLKAILLSLGAGLTFSLYYPLAARSREGEIGLGPYSCMFLIGLGVFLSAPILFVFFINLPVEGEPLQLSSYFKGALKTHLSGLFAGVMWCTGMLIPMVVDSAEPAAQVPGSMTFPIIFAVPLVSALWGFGLLKEFPANAGARIAAILILFLLAVSVAIVALAPPAVKAV